MTSECLLKDWNLPIYMFFKPTPSIKYINSWCVHVFECTAKSCKGHGNGHYVCHYLDTSDMKSTSNLHKHAKICWTNDIVAQADKTKDVKAAQAALADLKDVDISITAVFDWLAKSKVTCIGSLRASDHSKSLMIMDSDVDENWMTWLPHPICRDCILWH